MLRLILLLTCRTRMSSLWMPKTDDKKTKAVQKQGDGQADINIFTVASGLLYEVVPLLGSSDRVLSGFAVAFCFDHDFERAA